MTDGIINVYKERGFTSHDVVAKLRGILRQKKNVEEIPVIMKAREGGVSSISPKKSVYYMIKVTLAILIERIRK